MSHFIGFGNGTDGNVTLTGTDAPIDSACTGTLGTNTLNATNASFAAGQIILVHQTRGYAAGLVEFNQIASYSSGTITTNNALEHDYNTGAQVLVAKQYSTVTISSSLTAKAYNGTVGGILCYLANTTDLTSSISVAGLNGDNESTVGSPAGNGGQGVGYRGGVGYGGTTIAGAGEGTSGPSVQQSAANGNGGGGAIGYAGSPQGSGGGGGGGNSSSGITGGYVSSATPGSGGNNSGSFDLDTLTFGGGGGGGSNGEPVNAGCGGGGGGIVYIASYNFTMGASATISANGGGGGSAIYAIAGRGGAGGGGGGGSIIIKSISAVINTNKITATAGSGGSGYNGANGGNGSSGRIRIEACSLTGSTNPPNSASEGGYQWCFSGGGTF